MLILLLELDPYFIDRYLLLMLIFRLDSHFLFFLLGWRSSSILALCKSTFYIYVCHLAIIILDKQLDPMFCALSLDNIVLFLLKYYNLKQIFIHANGFTDSSNIKPIVCFLSLLHCSNNNQGFSQP